MTGSGTNVDVTGILLGAPVYQDSNGNILRASGTSRPAFAIATTGTPARGTVTYANDLEIERESWMPIAGTRFLIPDRTYYLSGKGKIHTSGTQVIGVAKSKTVLRATIQVSQAASTASDQSAALLKQLSKLANQVTGFGSVNFSAGTTSSNLSNIVFSNSNGVTFGLSDSIITAAVATNYAGTNGAITGGSITVNTAGVSVNLPAYLTTAMLSNAATISNVKVSAGTTSSNISAFTFSNGSGVSFGLGTGASAGVITATVATNYQSAGAYLTTAMASNRGSDFVAATAAFAGTNASGTIASNGISVSVAAPGGGAPNYSAGTTSNNLGSVVFSNSNGVSFGLNGSTITATVATNYQSAGAYLTTAALSQDSSKYAGTNGAITGGSITVNTSGVSVNLPAYLTTAMASNRGSDFVQATAAFAGTNASGTIASNGISVSVAAPGGGSSWTVSDNATSATVGRLAFTQSNGITMSLSTSNNGNHTVFASYTVPTVTNSSMTVSDAATSGTLARLAFTNLNGVTLSLSTGAAGSHTIVGSVVTNYQSAGAYLTTAALSSQTLQFTLGGNVATTNSSQILNGGFILAGGNNLTIQQSNNSVSLSVGAYITTADLSQNSSKYAGINGAITGGSITVNTSGVSVNLPAYLTTAAQSSQTMMISLSGNTATTNSSQISNGAYALAGGNNVTLQQSNNTVSISVGNYITTAMLSNAGSNFVAATAAFAGTNASGTIASNGISVSVAAPGAAAESNWHTLLGANVSGNSSASGSTIGLSAVNLTLSGTNNSQIVISAPATSSIVGINGISISSAGSTISILNQWLSSYENFPVGIVASQTMTFNAASVSYAVVFALPEPVSASFLRFPAAMTTNSTTLSTAAATMNGSVEVYSTWNAVVYSLGIGASSRSLQSVASGSVGATQRNSISVAVNGTQYSITQALSAFAEGGGTSFSTQYSASTSNMSFVSTFFQSLVSGSRFIDINFANSLSAGPYWLIFGLSTSSASNSARCSAASVANVGYASHYGNSQANIAFGIMGSTNFTSGGMLGAGSFSTAGGGTTASLPISAISTNASNVRPYFQLLRSA